MLPSRPRSRIVCSSDAPVSTELSVSTVGFGCARIGGVFEGGGRDETIRLLRRAFDAGINFRYGGHVHAGQSERLLGAAFGAARDRVVIASKFGYVVPRDERFISSLKPMLKPVLKPILKSLATRLGHRPGAFSTASPGSCQAARLLSSLRG